MRKRLAIIALFVGFSGCFIPPKARVPMETLTYEAPARDDRVLLILLPGRGSSAADFEEHGFIDAVRAVSADVDVVAVDAHFGYYFRRTLLDRLREDVIQPRLDLGYRQIWVAGASMGGFGAILCAREFEDIVTGAIVLSPYLGPRRVLRSIDEAGGPRAWTAPDHADEFEQVWSWLKGYAADAPRPEMFLAFGAQDRMSPGHELLGDLLPADRVLRVDGGHGWRVWDPLWPRVLEAWACVMESCN